MKIVCPNSGCGQRYNVSESHAGRRVVCRKCGAEFQIAGEASDSAGEQQANPAQQQATAAPAGAETPGEASAKQATSARPPVKLGRFEIRERLGAGGFGVVYRAYDPVLERQVALKVPHPGRLLTEKDKTRFLREAKAAGKLRHPNIVPVYDAGIDGGQYYIASAFIEGQTLQAAIEEGPFEFSKAASLVRELAGALHYAHRQGIVHRDVKPSNIMVDSNGDPLLMDFGLARFEEGAERLTHDGTLLGTPAYMSPEQALGKGDEVGPASDQYSLGVVLYELLCGDTPFSGPPAMVISHVINQEPPRPRHERADVPHDLETLCLKAMAKQASDRYPDCGEMSGDLRRWAAGELILARRTRLPERFWRWCRRNPAVASLSAVAVVLLTSVAVVASVGYFREAELRMDAENARSSAIAATEKAERQNYYTTIRLSNACWDAGHYLGVPEMLRNCGPEFRGWEWGYLMGRCPREDWKLDAHTGPVAGLAVGGDGRVFVSAGEDGTLCLWESGPLRLGWKRLVGEPIRHIATDRGATFVVAHVGQRFLACDGKSGATLHDSGKIGVSCFCLSASSEWLYTAISTGQNFAEVRVYRTRDWKLERYAQSGRPVNCLAVGADDKTLVALDCGGDRVSIYDAQTLQLLKERSTQRLPSHAVVDSRTGTVIWAAWKMTNFCDRDGIANGQSIFHDLPVSALALERDTGRLASCSRDGVARLVVVAPGRERPQLGLVEQGTGISAAAFLRGGLLTGDRLGGIRFWSAAEPPKKDPRSPVDCKVNGAVRLSFRSDGKVLALRDWAPSGWLSLYDTETGRHRDHVVEGVVRGFVKFRPCSSEIACAFPDSIRFFDTSDLELNELRRLPTKSQAVFACFDASGKVLAMFQRSPQRTSTIEVCALESGQRQVLDIGDIKEAVVAINGNGRLLAAAEVGGQYLHVRDLGDGRPSRLHKIKGASLSHWEQAMAFHPNGKLLAVAHGAEIVLWDALAGQLTQTLRGHTDLVLGLEFSPDGVRLASGSEDQTVRIWDWELGRELLKLPNAHYATFAVVYSPDGRLLVNTESAPPAWLRTAVPWRQTVDADSTNAGRP